jgi:hypothetical protein
MTSIKQIEANRRNAFRSTGPTSLEGKERSRRNAYRHGLTAETVVATVEDAEDYEAFQLAVASEYNAETATEREFVLRLASLLWRLRRATAIETALFERVLDQGVPSSQTVEATNEAHSTPRKPSPGAIANCFLHLMALPTCPLDRLSRYEHTLWRQVRQLIFTLRILRRKPEPPRHFPYRPALEESEVE